VIKRYTTREMEQIWSDENKFGKWLEIELAVCQARAEQGEIPQEAVAKIKKRASFSLERIDEIEKTTRHDVIAFLTNVAENVGPESRYIHWGMTSSDVLDTANALLICEALALILGALEQLSEAIKKRAFEHKDTVMIGRTHGIHAEPITFGLKLALWYAQTLRDHRRIKQAQETMNYGKISGAVGTFAYLSPEIEERACELLGLKPAPISSQIIQRDRYAECLAALAIAASSLEKFATEIRTLQRTEILEVEEFFARGQKGSSAMPHKRNPIACEQVCGLARLLRSNALAAMQNIALWDERDISHSSVERVILPDSTILMHYLLRRMTNIIEKLLVYPERMKENIQRTRGLIFSQSLMLRLTREGITREEAYKLVQQPAMKAWQEGGDFKDIVLRDPDISRHLTANQIEKVFNLKQHLRNVDYIFKRVFSSKI
jgi:adenylosuccinate lyase